MTVTSETMVRAWVQALIRHAARVGVPGVAKELAQPWPSPDAGEPFWQALQRLGLYVWWADDDSDGIRRQACMQSIELLYAAQQDCAGDVQLAAAHGSYGGLWLKAMATRTMDYSIYPSHLYRLATDLDVWFAEEAIEPIAEWLEGECNYARLEQDTPWPCNYELGLASPEGVLVELHAALGPRHGLRNWFGRLTPLLQTQVRMGMILPLTPEMQLVHAVVHFFQHAGHVKYFQLLELLLLLQRDAKREARDILLQHGYDMLWSWTILRLARLWPIEQARERPDFVVRELRELPPIAGFVWSRVLDADGIWRGPMPYRGPKALAVALGL